VRRKHVEKACAVLWGKPTILEAISGNYSRLRRVQDVTDDI